METRIFLLDNVAIRSYLLKIQDKNKQRQEKVVVASYNILS